MATEVRPGDVLCTRSGSWQGWLIRFGAALRDKPNLANHVAVAHHYDEHKTLWCIEGRPGGAGQRDARVYLASPHTITNAAQPKTDEQRQAVCDIAEKLTATAYDWAAIAAAAAACLGWELPGWNPSWRGTVPGHLICSSLAAYAYEQAGLPHPAGDRATIPGDWARWIIEQEWARRLTAVPGPPAPP